MVPWSLGCAELQTFNDTVTKLVGMIDKSAERIETQKLKASPSLWFVIQDSEPTS